MTGTVFGIGTGPGAPDLVTLRAARLISSCSVVAYPVLPGAQSFARAIVAQLIAPDAREIAIEIPMSRERAPAQAAYDKGAAEIAEALDQGQDVACLCEGDPFFYGSFMYLHARLAQRYRVQLVPGVSSLSAAACAGALPLVARNETLITLPAPLSDTVLREKICAAQSVAIMKLGRHLPRIKALLYDLGLVESATFLAHVSLPEQKVIPLQDAPDVAPYFSMILIHKGDDPWL